MSDSIQTSPVSSFDYTTTGAANRTHYKVINQEETFLSDLIMFLF